MFCPFIDPHLEAESGGINEIYTGNIIEQLLYCKMLIWRKEGLQIWSNVVTKLS